MSKNWVLGLLLAGGLGFLVVAFLRRRAVAEAAGGTRPGSALGTALCGAGAALSGVPVALPFCSAVGEDLAPLADASVDAATGIVHAVGGAGAGVVTTAGNVVTSTMAIPVAANNATAGLIGAAGSGGQKIIGAATEVIVAPVTVAKKTVSWLGGLF